MRVWYQQLSLTELVEAMKQLGLVPDVITHSALISAHKMGTQPELALELFEAMTQQGGAPKVITYSALISACEKGQAIEVSTGAV